MRVRHTTLLSNLPSIREYGICTRYSQGKQPFVWVHTEDKVQWAFLHTVRRHGGKIEDVVSLALDIPKNWLVRTAVPGLFYVRCDIPPSMIRSIMGFQLVSQSPLDPDDLGGSS